MHRDVKYLKGMIDEGVLEKSTKNNHCCAP
jgi:hypothetical protein